MCLLPGLVRLDLGLREGLDGDDEEVIGVVSGCEICLLISQFRNSVRFSKSLSSDIQFICRFIPQELLKLGTRFFHSILFHIHLLGNQWYKMPKEPLV